jgi:hypothetical protein
VGHQARLQSAVKGVSVQVSGVRPSVANIVLLLISSHNGRMQSLFSDFSLKLPDTRSAFGGNSETMFFLTPETL